MLPAKIKQFDLGRQGLWRRGTGLFSALRKSRGTPAGLALADQLIVGGMNAVTILLLGRLAGPDDLGVFALVMTVFYLVLSVQESLITMPYTIFAVRLKERRRQQYAGAALWQSTVCSAFVAAILALTAAIMFYAGKDAHLARVIGVFAIVSPLWLLREFGRRYFFAHMEIARLVTMSVVWGIAQLSAVCVLAFCGSLSAATALAAIGFGSGIAGFGWWWFNRAAVPFNCRRWSHYVRRNWVLGRWMLASQATSVLALNTMPWLVLFWLGPAATGVFAACDSILRFANPIIVSLNNVLTPMAAISLNKGGKAELGRITWKATALLSLFLLVFCAVLAVSGHWFLEHSFGQNYAGYWGALVVLGTNQLVAKISLAPGRALLVLVRMSIILQAQAAGLVTSVAAAALLLPRYGVMGAALSLLLGSSAISAITVGAFLAAMRDGEEDRFLTVGRAASTAAAGGVPE